jgi:DNA (cytosine-5)-methyltransferase 1
MISVDLFAGGGGASLGIELATGYPPVVAVNHDPAAIEMHAANHPNTTHLCESVFDVKPRQVVGAVSVDLLWASPDCTHFSRAKGGKPRDKRIRGLAWVIVDWAREVHPRVIAMENVPEFRTWGPLDDEGQPIPERAGETFGEFVGALGELGYHVEWDVLNAADFGAPTARRRLFLVARRDGEPVRWPEPTHGPGRAHPYRAAAECIDWSIPVPSIFDRAKPLAEATQRRIAEGVRRYVLTSAKPFIVPVKSWGGGGNGPRSIDEPMRTITTSKRGEFGIVAPTLINTRNGEREGQAPRVRDIREPAPTVTAKGSQGALVAAFLAKHYGGVVGQPVDRPIGTITATDHHSPVAVFLDKLHGSARAGQPIDLPAPTITAGGERGGGHAALVAAFLLKFYSSGGQWSALDEPMHTIVSKARMGLVTVDIEGETYALVDIGMRMLQPRELLRAQFSPELADDYVLTGTKSQQIGRIGNSVPPLVVEALLRANGFDGSRRVEQRELFAVAAK